MKKRFVLKDDEKYLDFITYGYDLDQKPHLHLEELISVNKIHEFIDSDHEINKLYKYWNNHIERIYKENKQITVPLSGGLDSRLILSSLLEFVPGNKINTFTFGSDGSLDLHIANKLATEYGTNHINYFLDKYNYNIEDELAYSKATTGNVLCFLHPPYREFSSRFKNDILISGVALDVFFGSHYSSYSSDKNAIKQYLEKRKYIDIGYTKTNIIQNKNVEELGKVFGMSLILDLDHRQLRFMANHICTDDLNWKTMFSKDICQFAMEIPDKFKVNQQFYVDFIKKKYSKYFKIGVKNNFCYNINSNYKNIEILIRKIDIKLSHIIGSNRYINYINFEKRIIEDSNFKKLLKEQILDLKNRKIIENQIINQALNSIEIKEKCWPLIHSLVSLEINLKNDL